MELIMIAFVAMTVYGVGVTVADMFGLLGDEIEDSGADGGGDAAGVADSGSADGDAVGDADSGDAADMADPGDAAGDAETAEDVAGQSFLSAHQYKSGRSARGRSGTSGRRGVRIVGRLISLLRLSVYFCLGAGPTGLFGLLAGYSLGETVAWSVGAGVFVAVLSRLLRRMVRKDLDSSIHPSEFLMEPAEITIPVLPGQIGRAIVRSYGREIEVYVKADDSSAQFLRGSRVRITEIQDGVYLVQENSTG
ncbi:MAG: hypothetical protein ACOC0D_07180 [Spirochaeta sp.]